MCSFTLLRSKRRPAYFTIMHHMDTIYLPNLVLLEKLITFSFLYSHHIASQVLHKEVHGYGASYALIE